MDNDLIGIARLRERRLLWTNQALQRMLKRPAGELLDHSARILYPDEETYERSGELAYGALRSSGKCHAQMQLQTSDGSLLWVDVRSEEHTSELQSQSNLVCRLLLEKKKTKRD